MLIHCLAGVSRSPAILIAYCIHRFKWSFQRAYDFVKEKRPQICPNQAFVQ